MDNSFSFIQSIRWQDIADILLNSYILFRFYVLFRGTNVLRILIGIGFLWFFQRMAAILGLIVTSWAIQGIIAVAAIIIIVVFRNEIRSVLQAKNLKAILWGIPRKDIHAPVDIIVEGIINLAQKRIGALLVIPGNDDLDEVIHSGITWNGSVSKEMLMSIFMHDSPVHDGAAIIRSNQITEVGAILPLSRQQNIPSYYGTRHRAAAGLTEATDALVIIVSEERGMITAAKNQQMTEIKKEEDLSKLLTEYLGLTSQQRDNQKREKLNLGVAALLSLAFVSIVWFNFTRGMSTLISFDVPIEYMNRNPSIEIIDASVNTVRVYLNGSEALIQSIEPSQARVKVDLSKVEPGPNNLSFKPENISLPPGVTLKKFEPSNIEVTVDLWVEKVLPVQIDWVGKLPEEILITDARIHPETIRIMGGALILENIHTVYTEKISVDNIKQSATIESKLLLNPAFLKVASSEKEDVTIQYQTKKRNE